MIPTGCFKSFSKELDDKDLCGSICYSFVWTYGIDWASMVLALVGATIASTGVFRKTDETQIKRSRP